MKNNESTLDDILKKAASFSEQIEKVQSLSKEIKEEKSALSKKETSLENDLLSLVQSLHEFQQETISTMSELYAKIQVEAQERVRTETKKPAEVKEELEAEFEVKVKPDVKEEVKEPARSKGKQETQKEDEEVFLFDL